jgi:hypothetical protein
MIVVIQCAASKDADAGHLVTADGKPVTFVAHPEIAPKDNEFYVRPDDAAGEGKSWRDILMEYNGKPADNPYRLLPAYRLYRNAVYRRLVERLGIGSVYILSAGWGLITANFLTPYYDITFSRAKNVETYKRRGKTDRYRDICMLPDGIDDEIIFFGGRDYLPLFCMLTEKAQGKRKIFYNSALPPHVPGCTLERFETSTKTNWHYECANAFLDSV